jgi:hypothetical protein
MRNVLFFFAGVAAMMLFSAIYESRANSVKARFARFRDEFQNHVGRRWRFSVCSREKAFTSE